MTRHMEHSALYFYWLVLGKKRPSLVFTAGLLLPVLYYLLYLCENLTCLISSPFSMWKQCSHFLFSFLSNFFLQKTDPSGLLIDVLKNFKNNVNSLRCFYWKFQFFTPWCHWLNLGIHLGLDNQLFGTWYFLFCNEIFQHIFFIDWPSLKKHLGGMKKNCSPPWCHIHDTTLRCQCHRRVKLSKVNDTVECDSAVSKINIFKTVLPIILGSKWVWTKKRVTMETIVWNCIFLSWRKNLWKMEEYFFLLCGVVTTWNCWFWLHCFNFTTKPDSSMSITQMSLTQWSQWHRWVWLREVNDTDESDSEKSMTQQSCLHNADIFEN